MANPRLSNSYCEPVQECNRGYYAQQREYAVALLQGLSRNTSAIRCTASSGLDSTGMPRYLEINQQAYDKYKSGSK